MVSEGRRCVKSIRTKDADGKPNGWLLPLWNVHERPDLRPDQVYLTTVAPGMSKGPHLHKKREQRYYLIQGRAVVIVRTVINQYQVLRFESNPIVVPAGVPSEIVNVGSDECWIINMPTYGWRADDPDDWPVENWNTKILRKHVQAA